MSDTSDSILVVTQRFPPETGADPTRWDELTKRWAEKNDVTVLTSAPDHPEGELYEGYDNDWIHREEHNDVDVIYTKTYTASNENLQGRSIKYVWFMILSFFFAMRYTAPDVVVSTSPQPLTGVSGWLIARVNRGTFVFEVRDLWPESILAVSDFDNRLVIWALDHTVGFLYRRADMLVIVSQAFIDPIAERDIDRSKIVYHPNGIHPEFYESEGEPPPAVDEVPDGFTVSYVGTIGRAHGLSILLDVAPELPDVQFMVVGDGAERERLETSAQDIENLIFMGRRPKSEIPYYLAESDVALVPLKKREVFETVIPSKMLEAMAAGLPVILGVRGEAERVLSAADAGIAIEPENADELIEAVRKLRDNDDLRDQFATNGREFVTQEFNWNVIASAYVEDLHKAHT